MSMKHFILCVITIGLISACQGPSGVNQPAPAYGNLDGIEPGPTWSTESLQTWLSGNASTSYQETSPTGVCTGLASTVEKVEGLDTFFCYTNISHILANPQFGGFNVEHDVVNNALGVTQVKAYKVLYTTPGVENPVSGAVIPENVSGVLLVPNIALSKVKGVVLYYHGTILEESAVLSNFNNRIGLTNTISLAAVFAAQGYIVVAPDYIGMGVNVGVVHPYIAFPEENAKSGIYMLNLVRQWLNTQSDTPGNMNLYIDSYSEGALYGMWASNIAQNNPEMQQVVESNNFTLKRTVVVSGPYDIAGVQLDFSQANAKNYPESENTYHISPGVNASLPPYNYVITDESEQQEINQIGHMGGQLLTAFSKAGVVPGTLNSIAYYSYQPQMYQLIMHENFVNMTQCLDTAKYFNISLESQPTWRIDYSKSQVVYGPCKTGQDLQGLFSGNNNLSNSDISYQLFASAMGSGGFFTGGMTLESLVHAMYRDNYTNNSINSFVYPYFLTPDVIAQLEAKSLYNWTTNNPVSIIWMRYDSTITNLNGYEACVNMSAKSAPNMVHCNEIDNTKLFGASFTAGLLPVYLDHSEANTTLSLVALHEIESSSESSVQ